MKSNIAIFGSAFNPPSLGHKSVLDSLSHFDQILLVPSIAHAWGKDMLPFDIRCQMVEKFLIDVDLPNAKLSRIEEILYTPGDNVTTFSVLNNLQELYPEDGLTFVIGPDNFAKFSSFYKADAIMHQWSVLACPETLPIRSTSIRQRCLNGESIEDLTTPLVNDFIQQQGIYRD
ncbi:nicotinate-nicotinamide nucleotide adenylyltransferase [Vibrio rumoiensis]|uniref:nicotinate-nucleotide adenylyltransferase n=1 Tax=Vibrio rumoiensis 1S-45 TaxID=1188252 RepID=A0A1E5E4X3_9VIBR|nr:nicotinate-nicotinamide nucleotide adenylyltransferase [Vibrio rumoiensis]OEF27601.1 nicotinate-nicotinamide nucleotide adenylyltransferase [Vibrio rumoiensis 1S-45]